MGIDTSEATYEEILEWVSKHGKLDVPWNMPLHLENRCTCDIFNWDGHTCPYAIDVGDEGSLPEEEQSICHCCPECTYQHAMDI